MNLDALIQQHADLWRGRMPRPLKARGVSTSFAELDRELADGGWPRGALTEILSPHQGREALNLVVPALRRLSREARWIAWVAPPFQPYPPALRTCGINLARMLIVRPRNDSEVLWSAEQALSSGTCTAVLLWPHVLDDQASRRLQLAAEKGGSWAIAFRPLSARHEPSAAALRLELSASHREIQHNRGSFSLFAFYVDKAPVVFNCAPNNRHAKSGSTSSHGFFGVKWFENSLKIFLRDSNPRILYL